MAKQDEKWNYLEDGLQRWRKRPDGSVETETVPSGESLTQQQFIEDCDVNLIMAKYMKTGQMPEGVSQMIEGDFSNLPDYQEALHTVMRAEEMFMEIPATIRLQFENNPQKLLQFLHNTENKEEAIKLGLISKPRDPEINPTDILKTIAENTKPKKADG